MNPGRSETLAWVIGPLALLACTIGWASPQTAPRDLFFQPLPALEHPLGLELLFSPRDNVDERVIAAIDDAKTEVLVNHYFITNLAVLDALQRAYVRKCVVMVLLDATPALRDYQGFNELTKRKLPFVRVTRPPGHWSDSKYVLVDRAVVLTGSADLSNAARGNDETLLVLREPSVVIAFYNHFVATAFPSSK